MIEPSRRTSPMPPAHVVGCCPCRLHDHAARGRALPVMRQQVSIGMTR
ncbi:hypothetical protein [Gemmatimonas sp. UBA7669]|nr:hypothetical protein [Gemmatimonas sp. UBA7669]